MTTILRIDASIRPEGSVTRAVASSLEASLVAGHPAATIVRRELGLHPLPSTAWPAAASAGFTPDEQRSPEQREAVALATTLADELADADAFLFAVPLYNWGVSEHIKAWVDLILTEPRFGPGAEKLIAGRPAYLVTARGGFYAPGSPREGWDHSTPWLRRVFADVWGLDLNVVETEMTLADVNPAMAGLRDLAAQNLEASHDAATAHGRGLADRMTEKNAA